VHSDDRGDDKNRKYIFPFKEEGEKKGQYVIGKSGRNQNTLFKKTKRWSLRRAEELLKKQIEAFETWSATSQS